MAYERDNIRQLEAYVPGEQPQPGDGVIKLNTNENPYPPAEAVLEAIHGISGESLRLYPPPEAGAFRKVAASIHGVGVEQVIATNGGDELLRLAVTVFCEPGAGGLGMAEPSYSLFATLGGIQDTPVTQVALDDDWSLPDDFADRLNDAGCRLALVVNPHAPSGRLEPVERLEQAARKFRGVLVIDEAYVDFASHDALGLLTSEGGLDNVLILRTLSKGYSLAGMRFGYGLGHARLIAAMDKARDSYNTDIVSQAAAVAALRSRDVATRSWQRVIDERRRMTDELCRRGYRVYPSESNFLLVVPPTDADLVYRSLKNQGVLVRYFDKGRLRDKLRITIGTPQQNDRVLATLDEPA
ncbi:MAG: histidinol-phosphate transaminase [Phycisphaeraceae bacterium]